MSAVRFPAWGLPEDAVISGRRARGGAAFRDLCAHPEVLSVFRAIDAAEGNLVLTAGTFVLRIGDERVDPDTMARAVTTAFQAALDEPWERLRARGLAPSGVSGWWSGTVEDVTVQLRPLGSSDDRLAQGLQIEASLPAPLPPETVVCHRERGSRIGADRFDDLFLGRMLDLVSSDPAEVNRRLAVDGVREVALELLHGLPESRLLSTHLIVVHEGPVRDPGPWLDRVLELVLGLIRTAASP